MTIAVSTGSFTEAYPEGYSDLLTECFTRLLKKYPQHHFVFIVPPSSRIDLPDGKNMTVTRSAPRGNSSLLWRYWFDYRLPAVLRKCRADVLVCMDGICSLRTTVPQCLIIPGTSFIQHPQSFNKKYAGFYKRTTAASLAKAAAMATVSQFSRSVIAQHYKTGPGKIAVICAAAGKNFAPISFEEKEKLKQAYADGKEYFLFSGGINAASNLLNLLKAFSFFKKRQKSNMLLLIAGKTDPQILTAIKTYKFRNEVRLLGELQKKDLGKITAAAYAFVYPVLYEDLGIPVLQAIQCEIPVVTSNTASLPGLCGEAALYADPANFEDIAEKMMLVFKDENKAKQLVTAARQQSQLYHWSKTADQLWQTILTAHNS